MIFLWKKQDFQNFKNPAQDFKNEIPRAFYRQRQIPQEFFSRKNALANFYLKFIRSRENTTPEILRKNTS